MNYDYELYHYGVKGMKWGVRKKRAVVDGLVRRAVVGAGVPNSYGGGSKHQLSRAKKDLDILDNGGHLSIGITKKRQAAFDARDRAKLEKKISNLEAKEKAKAEKKEYDNSPEGKAERAEKMKKAAKVGAAVAGTALAAYGTYKAAQFIKNKNAQIHIENGKKAYQSFLQSTVTQNNIDLSSEGGRRTASIIKDTFMTDARGKANYARRNDSLATAAKNVYKYYRGN